MPTWLLVVLGIIAAVILLLLIAVVVFQDRVVYIPDIDEPQMSPEMFGFVEGVSYEDLMIPTRDGEQLHALFFKARAVVHGERAGDPLHREAVKTTPTILWLHANAGTVDLRLPTIHDVVAYAKCNVFIIDYRGYGDSTGKPSEPGLKIDAEDALQYLRSRSDIDTSKIVVFGRSLGGAVAVHLATNPATADKFGALLLENTFTTLPDLAVSLLPLLLLVVPFSRNQWRSIDEIRKHGLKVPTMFFAAVHDEMIPHQQMCDLYETACSSVPEDFRQKIRMRKFLRGRHMSLPESNLMYFSWLRDWLVEVFPEIATQLSTEARSQLQFQIEHPAPAPSSPAEPDHSEGNTDEDEDIGESNDGDDEKDSTIRKRNVEKKVGDDLE